jgi:hypothetical protein
MYEADIAERMSEASSIELVIQGGDNQAYISHQFPQNAYQVHPEKFTNNFMQSFPPLSSSIVSNVKESDIFYEYVQNPYNTPIQYDSVENNVNNETPNVNEISSNDNSTMFQSSSYFNASETKDLLFIDPSNNSSKHELFDQP